MASIAFTQTLPTSDASQTKMGEAAPLVFWNRQITVFRSYYNQVSPAERAQAAAERLSALPEDPDWQVTANETTSGQHSGVLINANRHFAFAILTTDLDTEANESLASATEQATTQLRAALEARSQQRSVSVVVRGIALSIVATVLLFLGLRLVIRNGNRLLARVEEKAVARSAHLELGGFNLREVVHTLSAVLAKLGIWSASLTLIYFWLTFVLLRFPYSRPWGEQLGAYVISLMEMLGTGLLRSIPGLFTVVVILTVARIVTRGVSSFFSEVENGSIEMPGLHRDTARASRYLVTMLIWIFAVTVAYPYIPGSSTDAFKGVSVLVGLMVSLGSAGFVNQVMSGLAVVYSRALRPGEFVRVGEDMGTVSEVGLLSTKILTPRKEEITIPNGVLVGTRTVNYSRHTAGPGAVISTMVTIGYDAPWRQVHAMLLQAAGQTEGVRKDPVPFVLQKALSDFFVEYELIFHVDNPARRGLILSEVHTHIQDAFNDAGVQIMSPHFESQPSEKIFVPKSQWFQKSTTGAATAQDRR